MTLNLSIHDYSLNIAGLNCRDALVSLTGSDSKLDQSGLVIFKGSLVLGWYPGFEEIDDRVNNRWAQGGTITLKLTDTSGDLKFLSRCSRLRIIDSSYDVAANRLTIQFADVLELLKFKNTTSNTAGQICLGSATNKSSLINQLLEAAGAPALVDEIPGALNYPIPQALNGSFIEEAGKIAAASGYVLFVDSSTGSEVIRAAQIQPAAKTATITINPAGFAKTPERIGGAQPACELICTGKAVILTRNKDSTTIVTEEMGPLAAIGQNSGGDPIVLKRTVYSNTFSRLERKRTIRTVIEEALGILFPEDDRYRNSARLTTSTIKTETLQYESFTPITGNSSNTQCQQGNQGRLKYHEILEEKLRGVALREMIATFPKKLNPDKLTMMPASRQLTTYELASTRVSLIDYSTGEDGDYAPLPEDLEILEPLGKGPRITVSNFVPIGALCPDEFKYSRKETGGKPESLTETDRTIDYWSEENRGEWHHRKQEYKALITAFPGLADKLRTQNAKNRGSKIALANILAQIISTKDETMISTAGQAQPPAADTYSPQYSTTERNIRGKARLKSGAADNYRQRRDTINFDYLTSNGGSVRLGLESAASYLADLWAKLLWGQYKASSYTTNLADHWFEYQPLQRVDVRETRRKFAYLADAWSIAISGNQCAVGFDGVYLGEKKIAASSEVVIFDPDNPQPEPDPEIEIIDPPYSQAIERAWASGGAISNKIYLYSRAPIQKQIQWCSGGSLRSTSESIKFQIASGGSIKGVSRLRVCKLSSGSLLRSGEPLYWAEITESEWQSLDEWQWSRIRSYPS